MPKRASSSTDVLIAKLNAASPIGARMGSRIGIDLGECDMIWVSTIEVDQARFTRCESEGKRTLHYVGELTIEDAARAYLEGIR